MFNHLVSVIVPAYNCEQYIEKSLYSILSQSYKNIEVIVIDDGSEDATFSIIKKIQQNDSRVILIHQDNSGVSVARNVGIARASGRYLTFCDSDDYMKSTEIESAVNAIGDDKRCQLICWKYFRDDSSVINEQTNYMYEINKEEVPEIIYDKNIGGYLWTKLFDMEIITKNSIRFDERIHFLEDELFVLNYLLKCEKVIVLNEYFYYYNLNMTSITNQKMSSKVLSYVLAKEEEYRISKEFHNSDFEEKAYAELLKTYSIFFKKILLNYNESDKMQWLRYIFNGINKYYKEDFDVKMWSLKEKVYFRFLMFTYMLVKFLGL